MPPSKRVTVSDLLDLVVQDTEQHKAAWWFQVKIKSRLRPFFGSLIAHQVGSRAVRLYVEQRRKAKMSNATINGELAILGRAFRLGLDHRPPLVKEVPPIKLLKPPPPREGFFEESELRLILKHMPLALQGAVLYYYSTGCRKSEATQLKWSQVDLENRAIRLEASQTKNSQAREIPIWGELLERLTFLKEERDSKWPESPWVFSRDGEPILDFRGAWDTACQLAGLWEENSRRRNGRPGPTRYPHDFRRTAIRNLVRAGIPEKVAMAISGHKTRSIFDRYNIVTPTDLQEAGRRMESSERSRQSVANQPTETEVIQ